MSVSLLGFSLGPSSFSTSSICRQGMMLLRDDSRMHQLCMQQMHNLHLIPQHVSCQVFTLLAWLLNAPAHD